MNLLVGQGALAATVAVGVGGSLVLRLVGQSADKGWGREALAGLAAFVVVAGSIAMVLVYVAQNPFDVADMSAFVRGGLAGAFLITFLAGGTWCVAVMVSWTLRRPVELPDLRSVLLEHGLLILFGILLFGTMMSFTEDEMAASNFLLVLLAAVYFVLFVAQALFVPWITLMASPRLSTLTDYAELQTWVDQLMQRHGRRSVPVRVQGGTVYNAFILWKPRRPLLIVGKPLLDKLSEADMRAVLAHGVAHCIRRDTVVLVWLGLITALVMAPAMQILIWPLFSGGQVVLGVALCGSLNGGLGVAMGFYMRRMEFRTDQLAVQLLGGRWQDLASALKEISTVKRFPFERKTLTHPSVQDRIDRLWVDGTVDRTV